MTGNIAVQDDVVQVTIDALNQTADKGGDAGQAALNFQGDFAFTQAGNELRDLMGQVHVICCRASGEEAKTLVQLREEFHHTDQAVADEQS